MQTFITSADENSMLATLLTFEHLDSARLGKQRVEAKQIYTALSTGVGWIHHPATKMWANNLEALALYGHSACSEWIKRGYQDELRDWFAHRVFQDGRVQWPWWFGHPEMVASHRSKLVHKAPDFYEPKFGKGPSRNAYLPYLWPEAYEPNVFRISAAEYKRGGFYVPGHWIIDSTRRVIFSDVQAGNP